MGDLEGILVISIEQAVAAPYASCRLADAGARVIKVERPEGDFARNYDALVNGGSAYFVWLNRGKESVCLDLKDDGDRAILRNMLGKADVLIQNLAPGAIEKLGFDPEDLVKEYPALIVCSISGYGQDGPRRKQKAYDLLIQAESGLCSITGTPEGPARVGVSACDITAGMNAFQAILQALIGRQKTGKGRIIDVSLFHAMSDWMNVPYLQHRYGHVTPARNGLKHPTIAPYGAFECADGKLLLFSIQNEREWQRLCKVMFDNPDLPKREGFRNNVERVKNRAEVDALCASHFIKRDREANAEILEEAGIAYGRLSDLDDLMAHPQNRYVPVETEHGKVELLSPGAMIRHADITLGPVPGLDEHGDAIRREFGKQSGG